MASAEDAGSVTIGEAVETGVKDRLEKDGDSKLVELYFGTTRDVREGVVGVVGVWGRKSGLEAE